MISTRGKYLGGLKKWTPKIRLLKCSGEYPAIARLVELGLEVAKERQIEIDKKNHTKKFQMFASSFLRLLDTRSAFSVA